MKRDLRFSVLTSWRCPTRFHISMVLALLTLSAFVAQAQTAVKGRVTEETGAPLPGTNVLVKGTTNGTTTDSDGNYTLDVRQSDAVLVFSFIGYETMEVDIAGQSTVNVSLIPSLQSLSEVVVVGYGTQRQEAVTGSVASISGEVMRDIPASNFTQALQGRLPGVEMSQTNTKPGAAMQIRIRGVRSLSGSNDPLIVLDGIPFVGSVNDINPSDIKSIDILKDASATAIYGSRGSNGVILITTNKGKKGQKAAVTYNAFYGAKTVFGKYPMMSGPEFAALRDAAGIYTSDGQDESRDIDTDWQDLLYRTATTTSHDVGISGGTDRGGYSFGAGYYLDQAVIPSQQFKRYSFRGSIDQEISDHIRLGFTTNNNFQVSEGNQVGMYGILSMSPLASPYNDDGTLKRTVRMPLDESWVYTRKSLSEVKDNWINETRAFASLNAFYGEVKIPGVEGLKYRANLGLDFRHNTDGNYTAEGINSSNPETPSTAGIANAHTYHWLLENLLTYDRTIADRHEVNVVALYSAERNKYTRSSMSARDIPAEAFQFYNLGQATGEKTISPDGQSYELSGLMSWMGRVMYSYDDRYMISATLRSDGSSRLASGHKWHTYPAISAGWNIHNEQFMQNISGLNRLKLRVGYGQTSNQAVGVYATLGRLSTRPYNFGNDTYANGYFVNILPNPGLGWEFSITSNYAVDFAVLNNRLSGTVEYYVTDTKDVLLGVNLPITSGSSSYTANIGETQNKGLELALNGVILDDLNGWTWEAGVNVYANRNKLVALASGQTRDEGNGWFVGHPIDAIFDYERIGLWQAEDAHRGVLEPTPSDPDATIGMIRVKYTGEYDANGVPTRAINASDRQIIDVQSDFQGGFNTRVGYKGFDLSIIGAFKRGGVLISTLYGGGGYLNLNTGRRNNVKVDYWTPENTDAKYPRPGSLLSGDNPKYANTLGYFDASYLKIRTISLGYDLKQLVKNPNVNLRLYFTVQNPFVMFSPYYKESGMDPEPNSYGNENQAVASYARRLLTIGTNTPSTRNYIVGVNLKF